MNASLTIKNKHPRKDFTSITQLGLKAFDLATTHATVLGPRLPQGMLQELSDDIEALGGVVPGAKQARSEAQAATAEQDEALSQGYARVKAVRAAVRKTGAPRDVQRAYGIGQVVNARLVRDVKAALQQIVDRASANPGEAAGLGIVQEDVDALKGVLTAITDADAAQEKKRARAPLSTKVRNQTAHRVLVAIGRIEGAGRMQFAADPVALASFVALGAGPKRSAGGEGKRKGKAPEGGEVSTSQVTSPPSG